MILCLSLLIRCRGLRTRTSIRIRSAGNELEHLGLVRHLDNSAERCASRYFVDWSPARLYENHDQWTKEPSYQAMLDVKQCLADDS